MSFLFKSSSPSTPKTSAAEEKVDTTLTSPVYDTGRNIDDIVKGLIVAINDTEAAVRDHIHASLRLIGQKEPVLVLSKGLHFLNNTSRSQINHRVLVMNVMSGVLDEQAEINKSLALPEDLSRALCAMSAAEIVADKSVNSEWQTSGCKLLISISRLAPDVVAAQMLSRFPTNTPPHYFVVKALADFAHKYPNLFVPHLKEVLTRALPILAMIRHDNLRWVFCAGLGRWAESIIVCEKEEASIARAEFAASMHTAVKHVMNEWLISREQKVRLASAESIGYMARIIEKEHLVQLFTKIIQSLLPLLKKDRNDQLPVTLGIQHTVKAAIVCAPEIVMEHLDLLLNTVHATLVQSAKEAPAGARTEKNELELMRVFEILGTKYTDQVVTFLQKHIDIKDAGVRIATLRSFRHVVATLENELSSYKDRIVAGINLIYQEDDYKVLYELSQLVSEMASRGYLASMGGTALVSCVIRGASVSDAAIEAYEQKTGKKPGAFTPATLRDECDKILVRFASNELAEHMDNVLWPFLLETLTPEVYTTSFSTLCQCISDIAKRKKNDEDFIIDFDRAVNLPKPNFIFARLLIMLSEPFGRNAPGVNILRALYCLSPNVHPEVVDVWGKKLPEMKKFLDGKEKNVDQFNYDQWENYLLNLVRDSIDAVNDDDWNVQLGNALIQHIPLYKGKRKMKKVLLSILGLIIQKSKLKEFINRAVGDIINGTDNSSDEERLGCARGLGQAAAAHTDIVLMKLQSVIKLPEKKKSGFSLFGGGGSTAPENPGLRATGLLSYGYVCMLTPIELITARVEVHVIANILPIMAEYKVHEVKENGLRAIDLLGKAVHPSRISNYSLKSRDELIGVILQTINQEKPEKGVNVNRLRALGLEALSTLINLPPRIPPDVQQKLLNGTLPILGVESGEQATDSLLLENIHTMLISLLHSDPNQGTLDDILQALEEYTKHPTALQRKRSINAYVLLLKEFAKIISETKPEADALRCCGRLIGKLLPRITENNVDIRYGGLDAIYLGLRLHYFMKTGSSADLPQHVQKLGPLRSQLSATEPEEVFAVSKEMGSILCEAVDPNHIGTLVATILATLNDVEENGARGSCVVLNALVRARGGELEKETPNYVRAIIEDMASLGGREEIIRGLLHAVRGLARHHIVPVMNALIGHKIPHSPDLIKAIQVFSTDKQLTQKFFEHLIDIMNNSQLFEERRNKAETMDIIATHNPSSATCALSELLQMAEVSPLASDNYAQLLCSILLRIGVANSVSVDPPAKDAVECLKNFLICVDDADIIEKLDRTKALDKAYGAQYAEAIQDVLRLICKARPELIKPIFDFIKTFVNRTFIGQRVAATCMTGVLLHSIRNDRETVFDSINSLLVRCGADEKVIVKMYALRGLAYLTEHPKDIMHRYATPVISALTACIEDTDEGIILESMKSLKAIFAIADDEYVAPLLMNLCVRLKPSFEKANPAIRESSIKLYGSLSRFCKGSLAEVLINNIHANLPIIILHLQDNDFNVVKACKEALRLLTPELGSEPLVELFKDAKFDPEGTVEFDVFSDDFSAVWVKEFPQRISDIVMALVLFFKSDWDGVTTGACLITGHILAKITEEQRKRVNLRHTCTGLVALLRHNSSVIREKAAKILGLLHEA